MSELLPYIFNVDLEALSQRRFRSCLLSHKTYDAIRDAQGLERHKKPRLAGLDAFLGWAAPCVDAVGEYRDTRTNAYTLRFVTLDVESRDEDLRKQLLRALMLWIGLACPADKRVSLANMLEAPAGRGGGLAWEAAKPFPAALVIGGTSARPRDDLLFDLLPILAARELEAQQINLHTPHEGTLVLAGPRLYSMGGQQLIRSYPTLAPTKGNQHLYFTEVFTISPRTDPERRIIQLTVQASTRVYGEGLPTRERDRHLDVFIKPNAYFGKNSQRQRAVDIAVKLRDLKRQQEKKSYVWASGERAWIDEIVKHECPGKSLDGLGTSSILEDDFAAMVRKGSVHGDFTNVGYGVSAVERKNYLDLLEERLARLGIKRIELRHTRFTRSVAKELVPRRATAGVQQREQIARALEETGGELNLCLLQLNESGLLRLKESVTSLLGPAKDGSSDNVLEFDEGFRACLHSAPAGPCSELLPVPSAAPTVEGASAASNERIELSSQARYLQQHQQRIAGHISQSFPAVPKPAGLIVEMDERILSSPLQDPYALNYRAGQGLDFAVQVKLVDNDPQKKASEKADAGKDRSVLLDVLRTLGVSFLRPHPFDFHAWWMVNDRANAQALQTPCRVQVRDGVMSVALLDPLGDLIEVSYPKAQSLLGSRGVFNLQGKTREEKVQAAERFYSLALPRPERKTIIFVEAQNMRQFVRGLQNSQLKPGLLEFGRAGASHALASLRSGANHSLVRLSTDRRPGYVASGNVMGTITGLFQEADAQQVFWVVRKLMTAQDKDLKAREARRTSRFEETKRLIAVNRTFPTMTEIFPFIVGADLDARQLAHMTRKAMAIHTTVRAEKDEAVLPFPLHEASLLG
ncbi:MAG: DUF3893 domain-containing protein [Ramlibacter sp.]|nr:DUF3893 domain-containing protein [Ramlibacter sp.]